MPIGYLCAGKLDLTVIVWDGAVEPDEWKRHVIRLTSDRRFPTGRVLVDATTAQVDGLAAGDASATAELFTSALEADLLPEKCAVVVTEAGYELGEVYQDHFHLAVDYTMFPALQSACAWLGVPWGNVNDAVEKVRSRSGEPKA